MSRGNQNPRFYTLRFDGACSGNPRPAGAGAALFDEHGSVLYHFRQGLGYTTNNVAEYRALILGLQQAIMKGCKNINVQGDSQLVISQVYNTIADAQANRAINLQAKAALKSKASLRVKLKKIVSVNDHLESICHR